MSLYLVAYYFKRPAGRRVRTQIAGWMSNENNVQWDEQVALTKNLRNRDLSVAKIILDLEKKKVVRNGWLNNFDFDELFKYFYKGYPQYTRDVMNQIDPQYLESIFPSSQPAAAPAMASGTISSV